MIGPAREPFRSVTQNMAPAKNRTRNAKQSTKATRAEDQREHGRFPACPTTQRV